MDELIERRQAACAHPRCQPDFDSEAAKSMTPDQVKQKYPRFYGQCPDCKAHLSVYASFEHYIAGDW